MNNLDLFLAVLTAIIVIMIVSQVCGKLITYIGQPRVVGEMVAGVLLGPTFFGYFAPEISDRIFRVEVMPSLFILSNLGLSVYMFLVGAEIDFKLFNRKTFLDAGWLSFSSLMMPFVLGVLTAFWFSDGLKQPAVPMASYILFMGTTLAITAFPMLARLLQEKKMINSRIGVLSLLSACIQDVVSWLLLAFVTAISMNKGYGEGLKTLAGTGVFVAVVFLVVKPLLKSLGMKVEKRGFMEQFEFGIILLLLLAAALITDYLGVYSVFGGFILGLAIPRSCPTMEKELRNKLKDMAVVLLLPIFFAFSGLKTNLLVLKNASILLPCLAIIGFAFIGKYVSCTLTMKLKGASWRDASSIGSLLNARGLMDLLVANIGLSYNIITPDLFSIIVLVAVTTTFAALPLYNLSVGKKNKKRERVAGEVGDLTLSS
ncbi:transporter [Chitinophaga varians]|uniref:Transporter n=1 Tax=Chitinophaga varians TaxID=2202339 RepID=A0A847S834_9BACT|nr:cation:proton antiporter [Chitinophaga varians]NLR69208.1 transporter [Chitinophaga varians]